MTGSKINLNTKRVSLTIPEDTLTKIDRVASLIQLSRSSLVSAILDECCDSQLRVLESMLVEESESGNTSRRATQNTRVAVQQEINALQSGLTNFSNAVWDVENKNEH